MYRECGFMFSGNDTATVRRRLCATNLDGDEEGNTTLS